MEPELVLTNETNIIFKKYMCLLCGYIYDEALGWPDDGILRDDFEMVEI